MFWWTAEDHAKVSIWRTVTFHILAILYLLTFVCGFLHLVAHEKEIDEMSFFQDIAYCFVGFACSTDPFVFAIKRKEISSLLRVLNAKNKEVLNRRENKLENRQQSNSVYCLVLGAWIAGTLCALCIPPKFICHFLATGDVYFKNYFIVDEPYSVRAFFHCAAQVVPMIWICAASTSLVTLMLEMYLRVCFICNVTAKEIRQLRMAESIDEEQEVRKLKRLSSDYSFLKGYIWFPFKMSLITIESSSRCLEELHEANRFYFLMHISSIFATMGIFIFLMLWVVPVNETLTLLPVPLYQSTILVLMCVLGQKVTNSVRKISFTFSLNLIL